MMWKFYRNDINFKQVKTSVLLLPNQKHKLRHTPRPECKLDHNETLDFFNDKNGWKYHKTTYCNCFLFHQNLI